MNKRQNRNRVCECECVCVSGQQQRINETMNVKSRFPTSCALHSRVTAEQKSKKYIIQRGTLRKITLLHVDFNNSVCYLSGRVVLDDESRPNNIEYYHVRVSECFYILILFVVSIACVLFEE